MNRIRRNPVILFTLVAPLLATVVSFGLLDAPQADAVTALVTAVGSVIARSQVTPIEGAP